MTWNEFIAELQKHSDMLDTEALIYLDTPMDIRLGEVLPLAGVIERYEDDHYNEDNNLFTFLWDKSPVVRWGYDVGDRATFTCTSSDWKGVGGIGCEVVRRLTEGEADLCETGPMYDVAFDMPVTLPDGRVETAFTAFEDELTPIC